MADVLDEDLGGWIFEFHQTFFCRSEFGALILCRSNVGAQIFLEVVLSHTVF